MKRKITSLLLILALITSLLSACSPAPVDEVVPTQTATSAPVLIAEDTQGGEYAPPISGKLTIIHMNDTHGRTQAEPFISQLAKDIRAGRQGQKS